MAMVLVSQAQQGVAFFRVLTEKQGAANVTPMQIARQDDNALNTITYKVTFCVELEDMKASKLYLRLGNDSLNFNKYNQVINLDGSNLPAGTTLIKNGPQVRICIGNRAGLANFVAEVEVESAAGEKSKKFQIVQE